MPTVLLTGANRGIGLELARGFFARGHTVIAPPLDNCVDVYFAK